VGALPELFPGHRGHRGLVVTRMFLLLQLVAARRLQLFLGDGDAEDRTGTHPNEVFGGAYNFCRAKFSDAGNIDKCATQLTKGALDMPCKGVQDNYGVCHEPLRQVPPAT
jgi:hypothetical protein